MKYLKGPFLHAGKAKDVYDVEECPDLVWVEYKDNLTAFNGKKNSSFQGKGGVNRDISSLVFRFLKTKDVKNHWVADITKNTMVCKKLEILPIEVVVRNRLAGSTAQRFKFPEGYLLSEALVELYYKKDELGDPFMSSEQAVLFGFVSEWEEMEYLKQAALEVNYHLKYFFNEVGVELIDFKLEFGKSEGKKNGVVGSDILLGDEISCDSCRLWDKKTGEKMDKDRFRLDLGSIDQYYKEVYGRLKGRWEKELKI